MAMDGWTLGLLILCGVCMFVGNEIDKRWGRGDGRK